MIKANKNFDLINSKFPHIGTRLSALWGTKECAAYFNNLMTDTREGKRVGFPDEVATALFRLLVLHDELYPEATLKIIDIWEQQKLRRYSSVGRTLHYK